MTDRAAVDRQDQIDALVRISKFRPVVTALIVIGGGLVALLEGVGLTFILPIIEVVQSSGDPAQQADGILRAFVNVYGFLGIPFSLGYIILGVSIVLTVRWTVTFLIRYMRERVRYLYTKELQLTAFQHAIRARIEYFDEEGSDDILNAIVTQADQAANTIPQVISLLEQFVLALAYLGLALFIAPVLTVGSLLFLGLTTLLFRYVIDPGYELGDEVAQANEDIQAAAQVGTQGIRDVKLFNLKDELIADFADAVDDFTMANIKISRSEMALNSFYKLLIAISIFVLIYVALTFANMSFSSLGVFLFTMFRLGPQVTTLNSTWYRVENRLPHLVRTQRFIDELGSRTEPTDVSAQTPSRIRKVEFDSVRFSYEGQEDVAVQDLSFSFEAGEFIGFVGQSGAGKSTIVSLLVRMYEPDAGEILANGTPIHEMDIDEWRSRIAVVRQDPFIFGGTLRYNLTVGKRDVSDAEIERICRITKVDEFLDNLPQGLDTYVGDEGVRLSGGQRQRVALARALLKDADVLVLDEATSNLDSNLEKQVQNSIERMEREYAIIGIAHRLSTVKNADRIYTLENGQITEVGPHDELITRGGKYAELYGIQSSQ